MPVGFGEIACGHRQKPKVNGEEDSNVDKIRWQRCDQERENEYCPYWQGISAKCCLYSVATYAS